MAILALDAGKPVDRDVLIHRFWGDSPPTQREQHCRHTLSALRKALGPELIDTVDGGYRLNMTPDQIDRHEFEGLACRARQESDAGEWERVSSSTKEALDLWRGEPLAELLDDEFAEPVRVRLKETRLERLELNAESLIATSHAAEVLAKLEGLVMEYPYRERLWECLMRARYQLGKNTDVLHAARMSARCWPKSVSSQARVSAVSRKRSLLQDRELRLSAPGF